MHEKVLLLLCLFFLSAADVCGQSIQPSLIHRYEKGYSLHSLEDNAAYLADSAGSDGAVVVRVCSKERMPLALSLAAADPLIVATILKVDYDFTPERVLFLRSEDCLGSDLAVAATELWAVPEGAVLPTSVESVRSDQVRLESIGTKDELGKGARDYQAATRKLIAELHEKPDAAGVVLGYYYKKPSPVMERRLREVRKLLEQSGLPQDRYCVRLAAWTGERSVDPPDPEPKYPSLFVVEVARAKDSTRK